MSLKVADVNGVDLRCKAKKRKNVSDEILELVYGDLLSNFQQEKKENGKKKN